MAGDRDVSERAIFVEHECVRIVERTGPGPLVRAVAPRRSGSHPAPQPDCILTFAHGAVKTNAYPQTKSPDYRGFSLERAMGLEPTTLSLGS